MENTAEPVGRPPWGAANVRAAMPVLPSQSRMEPSSEVLAIKPPSEENLTWVKPELCPVVPEV